MKNGDMPASPCTIIQRGEAIEYPGLTKREAFAMAAVQGFCVNAGIKGHIERDSERIAQVSRRVADAMLAELERRHL